MHLLRRGPGSRFHRGRIREVRRQPAGRRQAAALRRDVLDQIAACRRRRDHRLDLQGAGYDARLRLGRLGLGDGLFRDGRRLTNGWFRSACNAISLERVERMQSLERARPIWPILAAVVLSFGLLVARSEEHTSELQSIMRISYAV